MKHFLILFLSLPFFAGCASKHYSKFTGNQVWLTTKDAVADQTHAVPVYWNWPERPYRVMGSIRLSDRHKKWKPADTEQSARMAKRNGGDALIVLRGDERSVNQNAARAMQLIPTTQTGALVIQWKSQNDVDEESHRLDGLRAYLRRSYPLLNLERKNDLWEMGVEYVAWLGLDINAPQGAAKLENALSSLIAVSKDASPSEWLFKGILRAGNRATPPTEIIVYGIATLARTDDKVTIVSHHGKTTMNFHGFMRDDQLRGELDVAAGTIAFTGKAKGEMLPEKISLSGNGQVEGVPVQVSFILLR